MQFDPYGYVLEHVLYPAWEKFRGRPTLALLEQLQRNERASLDEFDAIRTGFLRRLVRHAYDNTTHYRRVLDERGIHPSDINTIEDLAKLPILTRDIARESLEDRTAAWPSVVVAKNTSGSTGHPLEVRFGQESRIWRDATRLRGFGWCGYTLGGKKLHFWGEPSFAPPLSQRAKIAVDRRLRRDIYSSCMVRSPEHMRELVATIDRERPNVMLAYAQAAADLARFINSEGLRTWDDIPVICGAERLWPHDRADMTNAFGPGVFETYGCREFMLIGSECEAHDGLHESVENLIVEILVEEPDGSMRPARPGEQGQVAITDLHNLACPMIRYTMGDIATARSRGPCACGRTLPRIGPIQGRVTDTMRDANGNPVEGVLFNILFHNMTKFARTFQVVQHPDRTITLLVVPLGPELPRQAEKLLRTCVERYMPGVPMAIETVGDIPLTAAGKHRRVIVEASN
ncbi:MAG: phenylacetate--CoA ligase family protein [Kofleriaceae bacterium]